MSLRQTRPPHPRCNCYNKGMKAIIGLGNPEPPYGGTRHNSGAAVAYQLCDFLGLKEWKLHKKTQAYLAKNPEYLVGKPDLYMNQSGLAVRAILDYYKILANDLFVIFDDLDLEIGKYKIQYAKGPKDHNGLLSVYQHLGTQNFWHVRIGVDGRKGDNRIQSSDYVLERFLESEQPDFHQMISQILPDLKRRLLVSDISNEVS